MKLPTTVRQAKRLVGFVLFFRFGTNLAQNLVPWYKLVLKYFEFEQQDDHLKSFERKKKDFLQATKTTLRLAKQRQQYVILYDASYYGSGFVLMIEDYMVEKDGKKKQAYAPVSLVQNCLIQVN